MKKLGLFFLTFFYLLFCLRNSQLIKDVILDTCLLFITTIMPSILPMYFIGNILLHIPFISKIFFPFFQKVFHFSNQTSCSIYLLSLLMGNPTTSILINKALNDNLFSPNEAKRMMFITFFMNPLFLLNVCGKNYGISLILGSILTSILLALFLPYNSPSDKSSKQPLHLFTILGNAPTTLLNILMMMLFINLIKTPFTFFKDRIILNYTLDFLDISSGLASVTHYPISNYLIILLLSFLVNFNGICLFIQTTYVAPFITIKSLFKNRLFVSLLSSILTLFIYLIFNS